MTSDTLPGGTVTFLFTDIEGSTTLWEKHGEAMRPALAAHDALLRSAVEAHNGHVVKTTGDGIHAVFPSAADGLLGALQAQRELQAEPWPTLVPDRIAVRMGLHTGEAELRDGDYFGSHVNRAARIMALGHGGQVLVSGLTVNLAEGSLPPTLGFRDLGDHTLRGLLRAEKIYQLVESSLPDEFPPLRSDMVFVGNLPARVTSFIGRAREMALVRERLQSARLLTLTGPGGTGKTRLALQVAADVQPQYEHGAWWVELAPVTDPAQVPATVAGALGLAVAAGMPIDMIVTDYLREKEALLILDNCEHLIDATARLAAELIETCPRLTILASSREGLGVYGESTIHLSTLTLPAEETTVLETIQLSEAVQLFVERAAAVRPGFILTANNAVAIAQIVRRLDGIPLAIELAAARITFFSVDQIAERLDDRFRLLTGGSRTALPRQQTLKALIDWSYDLLDEAERDLLARLSVFSGGWTFAAAEFLAEDLDVFTLLPALVNKSLVVVADPTIDMWGEFESNMEPRYHMLETIRQYARDRLFERHDVEALRDRHFDYFYQYAAPLQFGITQGVVLLSSGRLLAERDNFAAAVAWGLQRYPERVIEFCWQLAAFLADQNPGAEGTKWIRAALDQLDRLPPADAATMVRRRETYLKGIITSALLSLFLGELLEARRLATLARSPLEAGEGSPLLLAVALFVLGQVGYFLDDPETANYQRAALKIMEGIDRQEGVAWFQEIAYMVLAEVEIAQGNEAASIEAFKKAEEFLEEQTQVYFPWAEFVRISLLRARHVSLEVMRAGVEASLDQLYKHRSYRVATMIESDFAHILREENQLEEAADIYRRTILNWQKLGHRAAVANQLEVLAYIYRRWDQPHRAVHLLGAAERLREDTGQPMLAHEQQTYNEELTALRTLLPPEQFAHAWAEGRGLSTAAAVKLAVEDEPV